MRKIFALLAALCLTASAANAQVCFQFDNFCDAIQVNGAGDGIVSGEWSSWDCAGSDAPMAGPIDGGRLLFVCSDAACPFGNSWAFLVATPISAFWLYSITDGILFQAQSPYTSIPGACTNAPVNGIDAGSALGQ